MAFKPGDPRYTIIEPNQSVDLVAIEGVVRAFGQLVEFAAKEGARQASEERGYQAAVEEFRHKMSAFENLLKEEGLSRADRQSNYFYMARLFSEQGNARAALDILEMMSKDRDKDESLFDKLIQHHGVVSLGYSKVGE